MTVRYDHGGTHGDVSGLPDRIFSLTPETGRNGINFADFAYADAGHSTHSVVGMQIGVVTAGRPSSFSFSGGGDKPISGESAYVMRGPGEVGHATWSGSCRGRFLSLTPSAVERMLHVPLARVEVPSVVSGIGGREGIVHLLSALSSISVGGRTEPLFVESVALAIVCAAGTVPADERRRTPTLSASQTERLRGLIASQLASSLSLHDMAEAVDLSESYFVRAFKGSFGITPYQYVLRERVAIAQALLRSGKISLSEAATRSGFPDARRMGRTFRQVTGHSPTGATRTKRR